MKLSALRPLLIAFVQNTFAVTDWHLERPEVQGSVSAFVPPLKSIDLFATDEDVELKGVQEIYIGYRYDAKDYKDLPIGALEGLYATALLRLVGFYSGLGVRCNVLQDEVPISAKESQDGYEVYLVFALEVTIPFEPEQALGKPEVQSISMNIYRQALDNTSSSLVLEVPKR